MKPLEQKIESLLFFKNEPVSFNWLAKVLDISTDLVKETITSMGDYYNHRGISMVTTQESVALMTSESGQEIIASITQRKEERELSKQALETLSIVAYKGRVTKPEIDFIRGVNSVFILRNLLIRGLISKKQNTIDKRSPFYVPTHDLLSFLGITDIKNLPQFDTLQEKIAELDEQYQNEQDQDSAHNLNTHNTSSEEDIDND